jgi:RHS repeat-associated protein
MKKLALTAMLLLLPVVLSAQTGLPPFGSFTPSNFDTVNNQNLNAVFSIPIMSSPGRGLPLNLGLDYNTLIWTKNAAGNGWIPVPDASGNPTWGWQKDFPAGGSVTYYTYSRNIKCEPGGQIYPEYFYQNYVYVDGLGTTHSFPVNYYVSDCPAGNGGITAPAYASDGSGYYLFEAGDTPIVWGPNGQQETGGTFTSEDPNGNYVSKSTVACTPSCTETDWTDSIGNKALKIIYTPNSTSPTQIQYEFLDGTGGTSYKTITLLFQSYNIKTNFLCSGVTDYTGTVYLPYQLNTPSPVSGTLTYQFTYETTTTGFYSGRLKRVTLPTGGYYEYDYPGANDSINCSDGSTLSMNRVLNDGTNTATWNFVRNTTNSTTTVTTPALADTSAANDTVYTIGAGKETVRQIYSNSPGSGTPLRTVNTSWAANGTPATQVTILDDNSTQSEVATTFDSNGLLDSMTEYDWGTGAPGGPIRTTTYTYQTSSNYASRNIINLVISKQIRTGGPTGTIQYRQDTTYDGTTPTNCPTGVPQHNDSGYPCTMNYRGNPTAVTTYTSPSVPSGGITKNFTYDVFGNLLTAQLNCCESKTWTYSTTTQYSQPDSVTSGVSQTLATNYTYNLYLGLVATAKDQNNLETDYSYDFLRRPTQILQKNGSTTGETVSYGYDDINFKTTVTTTLDSSHSVKQIGTADALGRTATTTLEDAGSTVYSNAQTQYDLSGRAYKTSTPYTTGTIYWTTTVFDAIGRPTTTTLPDGSQNSYSYVANTSTVTDPAGKHRKSVSDGLGRLASVTEPDSTGTLNVQTSYVYTVLDALMTVTEGSQTRSYAYDALGRLTSSTTPEGGLTCFGSKTSGACTTPNDGYDSFDNLLKKTDARGVVNSYSYDGLNRLTQVSYNVSGASGVPATSTVGLTYGLSSTCVTAHGVGCIGQVITMTDGAGSENYTYNSLEQETQLQKIIGSTTYNTQYAYNLAGELTQITYPSSGRVVQQNLDAIGRLCSVGASGSTCTTGTTYATGYGYNAAQQLTGFNYGNGVAANIGYSTDGLLQLKTINYAKSGTTLFGLTYSYGSAGSNNGQISSITDGVDNGRSVAYTYDTLSRLSTAVTTGSTNYPKWGLQQTYDRYGNRSAQTAISGCTGITCPQPSVTVDPATNHITGSPYAYDANGNMTNDGFNALIYDAENRTTSATNGGASGTYTYDGNGLRVKKVSGSTTTAYVFSGSKVIAEYDNGAGVGSPSREYIYGGGTLLARVAVSTGSSSISLAQHTSKDAGTVSSSTLAFTSSNTAGNWIGVAIRAGALSETFTVSDSNGNTYHEAIQTNQTADADTVAIYYAENIHSGANTITVSVPSAVTLRFAILEYSGVATSSSLDVTAGAQGSSTAPNSGSATTTANGDLLLGAILTSGPATYTAGSGYTIEERVPAAPNAKMIAEDRILTTAGTASASASLAASDLWAAVMAAFKPATTGGTTTQYYHQDQLSNRLVTDASGNVIEQLGHFPFGESWYNSTGDKLVFTSYERDAESGNDYAQARYYVNRLGRFSSLDLYSGTTADPQSLNRYSYVGNNPIEFVDPTGMVETEGCDVVDACAGSAGVDYAPPSPGDLGWEPGPTSPGGPGNETVQVTASVIDPPQLLDLAVGGGLYFQGGRGGGGGGGGRVNKKVLNDCTIHLYGVITTGFSASVPGVNGSFAGVALVGQYNAGTGGSIYPGLSVVNNVTKYTIQSMTDKFGGPHMSESGVYGAFTEGFTDPTHPYQNYTASDSPNMLFTQLVELGNSLGVIANPNGVPGMIRRDQTYNSQNENGAPGKDLVKCLNNGGPTRTR